MTATIQSLDAPAGRTAGRVARFTVVPISLLGSLAAGLRRLADAAQLGPDADASLSRYTGGRI